MQAMIQKSDSIILDESCGNFESARDLMESLLRINSKIASKQESSNVTLTHIGFVEVPAAYYANSEGQADKYATEIMESEIIVTLSTDANGDLLNNTIACEVN
jgi:hypothetical protein